MNELNLLQNNILKKQAMANAIDIMKMKLNQCKQSICFQ